MSDTIDLGTRKGLFTLEKSHGRWQIARASFIGVQVPMFLHDRRNGALLATLDHGHFGNKVHRSQDGGATWEELPPPSYPPKPEDVPDTKDPMRGTVVPWSLEKVWSLEAGGADEPGVLWAGTLPGGLFRSSDGGNTWSLVESLWNRPERSRWFGGGYDVPGIHSISVDPNDSRHVLVAISCGGVWRTRDGGASWEQTAHGMRAEFMPPEMADDPEIQDAHRMVHCAGAPGSMWVQHHNGIFRSTNHGASWSELTDVQPSTFGFAVAAHPTDAGAAWFAPAQKDECRVPVGGKVVVTRTLDGGKTFEAFAHGLPQEHAYHLIYRHCLDVDDSGERLAMGSTTGGFWISEDGGESWQSVSHDLPPVFCVRFR